MSANHHHPYVLTAKDVAALMGISTATSYKIIRRLNRELESQGSCVIPGRVNREYFTRRYGIPQTHNN